MVEPPAERADEDQRPVPLIQRMADGVAGVGVVLLRLQPLDRYCGVDRAVIRVKIPDEQIRLQAEPRAVAVAAVTGDDKVAGLRLRRGPGGRRRR